MAQAQTALTWATDAAFLLLALASVRQYLRRRQRQRLDIAIAILLLTLVAISNPISKLLPAAAGPWISDAAVVLLLASGLAFLRFRADFIPLPVFWQVAAVVVLALLAVASVAADVGRSGTHPTFTQQVLLALIVLAWSACVGEPVVRFFIASRHRPPVQQRRLQALAAGYLAIIVILLLAGFAGQRLHGGVAGLAISTLALLSTPLIYVGFSPPVWLRRVWREAEEEAFRQATRDLLIFSPTRAELAQRAVDWGVRLIGGDAAFIADPDGRLLAAHGISEARATELLAALPQEMEEPVEVAGGATAIRLPLTSPATAPGSLVVVAGPFTPFFGTDEVLRLAQYAINTASGLDRASLTERISALERTKTEFLNLASHELRGPLTVIRGYLSMLREGSLGQLPPDASEVMPVLLERSDQMNRLVEQMLEASRLEEGRLELKLEPADLRDLVRAAIEDSRPITTAEHRLALEAPPHAVPVTVDRQRITTIVTNLISNAIKYSPAGGEVRLKVERDGQAIVAVCDQGVGIAPPDQSRLFTRFGRITTPDTRNVPGTGLGLYLSRELARLHGGDLIVQSQVGSGSTFTLVLPLERP